MRTNVIHPNAAADATDHTNITYFEGEMDRLWRASYCN